MFNENLREARYLRFPESFLIDSVEDISLHNVNAPAQNNVVVGWFLNTFPEQFLDTYWLISSARFSDLTRIGFFSYRGAVPKNELYK